MNKTLFTLLTLSYSISWAGSHVVGNGGDVVVCQPSNGSSVELLDYVEAKQLGELKVIAGSDPIEIAEQLLRRYSFKPLIRGAMLIHEVRNFRSKTQFVSGRTLTDIPDSLHLSIPAGCQVHQAAIQGPLVTLQYPDKFYLINEDLWNQLDAFGQAGLVVHEVLYREASLRGAKNSLDVRHWVGSLARHEVTGLPSPRHEALSGLNRDRSWGDHGLGARFAICEAGLSWDRYFFAKEVPSLQTLENVRPKWLGSDAVSDCLGNEMKAWTIDPESYELSSLDFKTVVIKEHFSQPRSYWVPERTVVEFSTIDDMKDSLLGDLVMQPKAGVRLQLGFGAPFSGQDGPQISSIRIAEKDVRTDYGSIIKWDRVFLNESEDRLNHDAFRAVLAGDLAISMGGQWVHCTSGSELAGIADARSSGFKNWVHVDGCRTTGLLSTVWRQNSTKAVGDRSKALTRGKLSFKTFTQLVEPPQQEWLHFLRSAESRMALSRYIPNDPTNLEIPVTVTFQESQKLPIESVDFRIHPRFDPAVGTVGILYPSLATIPSQTLLVGKSILNEEFKMVLHSAAQVGLQSRVDDSSPPLNGAGKLQEFTISTGMNVPVCNETNWKRRPVSSDFPIAAVKGIYLRQRVLDPTKPKLHCFQILKP